MKTSTTSFFVATTACMASIALFAQNGAGKDNAAPAAPAVLPMVVVKGAPVAGFNAHKDADGKQHPLPPSPGHYFLSETDHALNRFTLPLFGRTPEQRALARLRENQRLEHLDMLKDRVAFLEQTDPGAAKRLQQEMYSLALHDDSPTPSTSLAAAW